MLIEIRLEGLIQITEGLKRKVRGDRLRLLGEVTLSMRKTIR